MLQISNFFICGILSAGIYYASLYLSIELLKIRDLIAVTLSHIISSIFNFYYNKFITFKCYSGIVQVQIFKYIFILFLNYFCNLLIIYNLIERFSLNIYISSAFSILLLAFIKFFLSKYFIYK